MLLWTPRCAGCDRPGVELCRTCRFALIARPTTPAPDGVIAGSAFTGRVRDVLLGFKYGNRRAVAGHLGGIVVNRLVAAGVRPDVVTWAPTSAARRRARGFDQAELVARQVARQFGVPCRRLLEREGPGSAPDRARTQRTTPRADLPGPPARPGRTRGGRRRRGHHGRHDAGGAIRLVGGWSHGRHRRRRRGHRRPGLIHPHPCGVDGAPRCGCCPCRVRWWSLADDRGADGHLMTEPLPPPPPSGPLPPPPPLAVRGDDPVVATCRYRS